MTLEICQQSKCTNKKKIVTQNIENSIATFCSCIILRQRIFKVIFLCQKIRKSWNAIAEINKLNNRKLSYLLVDTFDDSNKKDTTAFAHELVCSVVVPLGIIDWLDVVRAARIGLRRQHRSLKSTGRLGSTSLQCRSHRTGSDNTKGTSDEFVSSFTAGSSWYAPVPPGLVDAGDVEARLQHHQRYLKLGQVQAGVEVAENQRLYFFRTTSREAIVNSET